MSLQPVCAINSGSLFLFQVKGRRSPELEATNSAVTQLIKKKINQVKEGLYLNIHDFSQLDEVKMQS